MKHLFSIGLRPFFFLTALSAVFFPMYLVCVLFNFYPFPGEALDVVSWHAHELLFGMIPSLLAGFLLTASSNWTRTPPMQGAPLAAYVALWLGIRILFFIQPSSLALLIAGPLFLIILIALMLKKLRYNRNFYLISSLLGLLTAAQFLYLYGSLYFNERISSLGLTCALFSIYLFLFVFSGRLIPFFTNNRFREELVKNKPWLESSIVVLSGCYFFMEAIGLVHALLMWPIALLCSCLLFYRSYSFYSSQIWQESMVSCLHLAHLWLPTYFALKVFEKLFPSYAVGLPATHALLVGGLGMFGVSIMGRASMGHTGRPILSSPLMLLIFLCIYVGAILRVFQPIVSQEISALMLHSSMGVWTLGFILFLIKFAPYYFKPRPDRRPY